MNSNEIKVLSPNTCPHCHEPILVEMLAITPTVVGLHTMGDIESAKLDALEQIQDLEGVSFEAKDKAINWIKKPDTIFVSSDIEEIIENLKNDHS